jgi:hypothetical protein
VSARVSPTDRVRAKIDELFASGRELPEILEEVTLPVHPYLGKPQKALDGLGRLLIGLASCRCFVDQLHLAFLRNPRSLRRLVRHQ